MAALFGGRSKGNSSSDIKYTELPQHISDDEDELYNGEDDLLFVASSSSSLQNGTASHTSKRNGLYRQGDVIEMGNLGGSPIKRARLQPSVEVRPALFARKCLFIFSILVVGALVIALSVGLPGSWQMHGVNNSTWAKLYDEYGTESCIRLHDLDGDGLLDIVFGMGSAKDLTTETEQDLIDYCKSQGRTFPCVGVLIGLRGKDGQELWRVNTESAVFLMNCEQIDVNQDGKTDCIVSGRQGTIAAINPKTGEHLWKADRTYLKRQWNIYQVSALPDLDGDGVHEILVPHGGEPSFPPEEHNRHPGRLIVLSGRTGKSLGRYLDMPDSKETYMSAVIYTMPDESQYILFGSGGETIPGDFMAISLRDFYRNVMNTTEAPMIKGNYSNWSDVPKDEKGIMKLFSGKETGVMVPPVMADVNNDGVKDILMTAFEGKMVLFDGKTLKRLWTLSLKGCQTYSTPAPGYFDGDDHLDFMTSWNNGTWPDYKYAMMIVVSGADGVVLWKTYSQEYNMASPLSLQTSHYHQDAFLYQLVGRTGKRVNDVNGAIHGLGAQRNLTRRSTGSEQLQDFSILKNEEHLKHGRKNGFKNRASVKTTPQPTPHLSGARTAGVSQHQRNSLQTEPLQDAQPQDSEDAEVNDDEDEADHLNCAMDLSSVRSEIFLMDRTTLTAPVLVWQREAETYNYTLTDEDRNLILVSLNKHRDPGQKPLTKLSQSSIKNTLGNFCTVLAASVLTTGAVGDVDGDGSLDYIALDGMIGLIKDRQGSYIRMQAKTYVSKVNLVAEVRRLHTINIKAGGALQHTGSSGKRFQFLDYNQQKWTQYLGKQGNGVY